MPDLNAAAFEFKQKFLETTDDELEEINMKFQTAFGQQILEC